MNVLVVYERDTTVNAQNLKAFKHIKIFKIWVCYDLHFRMLYFQNLYIAHTLVMTYTVVQYTI